MRTCEQCGQGYARRKKEAFVLYAARRFCSKRCAGLALNPRKPADEFRPRYRKIKTPDGRHMLEHRWVMEKALGRPLRSDEQVHHKNHDRLDNRPENLEVVTSAEHGERHTWRPVVKACAVCGSEFTPHKTKRARAKTCGPECASVLRVRSNRERRAGMIPQQAAEAIRWLWQYLPASVRADLLGVAA